MHLISTLFILLAALVNLAPLSGLISDARMEALYGLTFEDPTLLVRFVQKALEYSQGGERGDRGGSHADARERLLALRSGGSPAR